MSNVPPNILLPTQEMSPWPETTMAQFARVPLGTTDESCWYGPWDTILHDIFHHRFMKGGGEAAGFEITPQHIKVGSLRDPEKPAIYLVVRKANVPVCVVEVKPYLHLKNNYLRYDAYEQLEERLHYVIDDDVRAIPDIQKIYGVQCMGPHFMIMTLDTQAGSKVNPPKPGGGHLATNFPQDMWKWDVTTLDGAYHIFSMARDIHMMTVNLPGVPVDPKVNFADLILHPDSFHEEED